MNLIIAIDGPAGSGKGTLARRLAAHYGLPHLDTGLLYRAVAYAMMQGQIDLKDMKAAARIASTLDLGALDEIDLQGSSLGEAASVIAVYPDVREALLQLQRNFAGQPGGAILDGRDIGTVVCPAADIKLYVTASPEVRAGRRSAEAQERGEDTDFERLLAEIHRRDERDSKRQTAPLKMAEDALLLETSKLDIDEAFQAAVALINQTAKRKLASAKG